MSRSELLCVIERQRLEIERLNKLLNKNKSNHRKMNDNDARRILRFGDLEYKSNNDCAKILDLSYGQIYSCRTKQTFRHIHKEIEG